MVIFTEQIQWCFAERNHVGIQHVSDNNKISLHIHQINKSMEIETKPNTDEDVETLEFPFTDIRHINWYNFRLI